MIYPNLDKTYRLLALLLLASIPMFGQKTVMPLPNVQWFDSNGNPISGAKLYTYIAGTTTNQATYTDYGGGSPNSNPVIGDSAGRMNVWLSPGASYRFDLYTSANVLVWSVDNIVSPSLSAISTCPANTVVAGPTTGAATAPFCRNLVLGDLPSLTSLYADLALDNLAAVSINTSLLAQAGVDVGSTVKPVRNIFLYGAGTYATTYLKLTGTPTSTRTVTFPDATDTVVELTQTQTLTNKTLTTPHITAPVVATFTNTGTGTLPSTTGGLPVIIACGATTGTAACADTATGATAQIYYGLATLASNTAVITISPGFTSSSSYACVGNDITTRGNPVQVVATTAATFTITNTTGAADVISWGCFGN